MPRFRRRRIRSPIARRRRRVARRIRGHRRKRTKQVIVSQSQFVKFRYMSDVNTILGVPSASYDVKNFNLNGLWDVEVGLSNANAPGFLEYAAFYQKYLVTYAVVRAEFVCLVQPLAPSGASLSTAPSYFVGIYAYNNNNTMPAAWSEFLRLKGQPWSTQRSISSANGMNRVSLKLAIPLSRFSGNKRNYLSDNAWTGEFGTTITGSNPANLLRAMVYVITDDGSPAGTNYVVSTRISVTMYARCYNRNNLFT